LSVADIRRQIAAEWLVSGHNGETDLKPLSVS